MDFTPAELREAATSGTDAVELASFKYREAKDSQLTFVNGMLRSDLSSLSGLPAEVVAIDLSQAISDERFGEIVWRHLGQQADYVANGFTALNTAFISHGVFIYIPKGVIVGAPIHLLFISDGTQTAN